MDLSTVPEQVLRNELTQREAKSKYLPYLEGLPLVEALWWFIENVRAEDHCSSELHAYLRTRYRLERQES